MWTTANRAATWRRSFVRSGYFDVVERSALTKRPVSLFGSRQRQRGAALYARIADDLSAGRTAQMQVLVDGTDSNTANIVLSYAVKLLRPIPRRSL